MLGATFSEPGLLALPYAPDLCAGCAGILGGKPGQVPTPFRMLHVFASSLGVTSVSPAEMYEIIASPPAGARFALVYSTTKKRHAWLHSEACDASRIVVGMDDGPAIIGPGERATLDAISSLVSHFSRDAVRTGCYPAPGVSRMGPAAWAAAEAVVSPLRPSLALDLLCRIVPRLDLDLTPCTEEPSMLDPADEDAAFLLTELALASGLRASSGLTFWGGAYSHRVQRFSRLPLPDMISRLMSELRVSPVHCGAISRLTQEWDDARSTACATAIRQRGPLLVALAFDRVQGRRAHQEPSC